MRLLIQHRNHYGYPSPAALGPHLVRLRPATHTRALVETYGLRVSAAGIADDAREVRWQQDPYGNHVARVTFGAGQRARSFDLLVEIAVDVRPVNPFDFFVDDRCKQVPFAYPNEVRQDLLPFLDREDPALRTGARFDKLLASLPATGETVPFVVACNQAVNERLRYVIREETGIWTPEETLEQARGSCRDSAVLLIALLRARGFAARFVSGYLVQLVDEGMIPDAPRGVSRDVVDLHAWAEVYLPGAGWIGLDATSGLLCGEGHIPLACTACPALASPVEGTSDVLADAVSFSMTVARLGHEPRPTAPFSDEVWQALRDAGERTDDRLAASGVALTLGGEPTFNARERAELPEWNTDALGATKWALGRTLALELRRRLAPGGVTLLKQGKQYPRESLPRWALEICARRDGVPLWPELSSAATGLSYVGLDEARAFAEGLAAELGTLAGLAECFEDPWRFLQDEASLPTAIDPLGADLDDGEERRRLARVLDQGLGSAVGFALPLGRGPGGEWLTEKWVFRRGHLFLLQGDSPIGLRLPLRSLAAADPPPPQREEPFAPRDPRRPDDQEADDEPEPASPPKPVRTALCVEPRDGTLHVFLPPLPAVEDFCVLVAAVNAVRQRTGLDVQLEGYGPPRSPELLQFAVTPDPGVLEVNLPVSTTSREYVDLIETVFDAALHAGLHSEKYLLDGRMAGSGGGNHLTLGGPTPLASPFLRRPDMLASLITFAQHHPSLSYLFTGLFVGPTSQAPRVDEARHDALAELEIALAEAFRRGAHAFENPPPPWLSDLLFRNLLVDVAGNTHRTEICLDKLFDPQTPSGRQGIVELRAFEMPSHPRLAVAQMFLVRALMAAFAAEPYRAPLIRWGATLHDKFLLPYWLWRDFEDVLAFLGARGLSLPSDAYRPFLELRCPVVGVAQMGGVRVEVRNALEPWPVLGEALVAGGTSRFVDSSLERVEVRTVGMVPGRHALCVNGRELPLRATPVAEEQVGGVRFRAWAPPHSLQAHLGIHHPLRFDVVDKWARRSLGACAYHVWHPEGRGYEAPPMTRFEAAARRVRRFTIEGQMPWPVTPEPLTASAEAPYSIDLRRFAMDHPMPEPTDEP